MILLNNSQYIEVSNVTINTQEGVVENAVVGSVLTDLSGAEIETFTLDHIGGGTYRADISPNLDVKNGGRYKLTTTINAEGLQAQWEQFVDANVRRK